MYKDIPYFAFIIKHVTCNCLLYKHPWGTGIIRINPFPNKPLFLHVWSTSLLKTLWEKEKLLVPSNFLVFSILLGELSIIYMKKEIVACKLFQFGRVQNLLFGKGLNQLFTRQQNLTLSKIKAFEDDKLSATKNMKYSRNHCWKWRKCCWPALPFFSLLLRMTTPSSMAASRFKYNT